MNIRHRKPRAFALITVLCLLVLLAALAVGFLDRTSTERVAAAGAQSAASTRQLADTSVALVQSQINLASTQGWETAWSSQPGMIRTFGTNGNLLKVFKLYSADAMIANKVSAADLPLSGSDWSNNPAIWTDLNSPVTDRFGTKNYPILDPSSDADGFGLSTDAPVASNPSANPVPMPVKWLYMLKDGTLVAPSVSGTSVAINGETYPAGKPNSPTGNPVVGRIAFWTDDETCKVNINTAAGGAFWDTPRAQTQQEQALGNYQPARKEFQRYPGHPAMTDLSAVFTSLTPDQLYAICPRIIGGGSKGGTAIASTPLTPDSDRLYATVDELMFKPPLVTATSRDSNVGIDKAQLEKAKFFVTTQSRAPELNLFNLPRIACWPIYRGLDNDRTTAFDRLIAYCSTVNGSAYYFQREIADSPTNDIGIPRNRELYEYLQYLSGRSFPGFSGDFLSKYGVDRDQILTEIFDYIRSANLYDDTLASGKQFTKGRDVNKFPLPGHGWVVPTHYTTTSSTTMGFGRTYTLTELGLGFICNAVADDPATTENESSGSNTTANAVLGGSLLQSGEKYIQAILLMKFFSPMQGFTLMAPDMQVKVTGLDGLTITKGGPPNALFPVLTGTDAVVSYSRDPGQVSAGRSAGGFCDWRYAVAWKGAPKRGSIPADTDVANYPPYPYIGIPIKIKAPPAGETMRFSGGTLTVEIYAGATAPLTDSNLIQTLSVKMPPGDFPIPTIASTALTDPAWNWGERKESWWTFRKYISGGSWPNYGRLNFYNMSANNYQKQYPGCFMRPDCDVVRSVLPLHGDFRLIAGQFNVPDTAFSQHHYYNDTNISCASNFSGDRSHLYGIFDRGGKYISTISYHSAYIPDIASDAKVTPEATGDYDTGISLFMDGPFINKPDDGSNYRGQNGLGIPYFVGDSGGTQTPPGITFFSPNRQMPSPGMFGSLPTGVKKGVPWQTLLFRPPPQTGHPGADSPRDSLILDFFWMPVVEPYAISDRFSTAGKINMNYQILPFTYIERSTGMMALLKSEKITAIPNDKSLTYKSASTATTDEFRLSIDAKNTLEQFQSKFNNHEVFKSASEICDLWIVPSGQTSATMPDFWSKHQLTGDNLRERIYTTLYPRLTTKSNTYTVHFRVQALRKVPSSPAGVWTEGRDTIAGEYRGSTTIERFINSNNTDIPDYAKNPTNISNLKTLDTFYKWRVVGNRQFAP